MWAFCTPQFALRVWSGVCDSRLPLSDDGALLMQAVACSRSPTPSPSAAG